MDKEEYKPKTVFAPGVPPPWIRAEHQIERGLILNATQVENIKKMRAAGIHWRAIAKRFKVSVWTATCAANNTHAYAKYADPHWNSH